MYIFLRASHTNYQTKGRCDAMESSRKKLRVCLILVVLLAVLAGFIYYFADVRSTKEMEDGVLVRSLGTEWVDV